MEKKQAHEVLLITSVLLGAWGFLLFFESAYFGAFFYGVPVPSWAAWVGELPIWSFNVIDTIMVTVAVIALVLAIRTRRKKSQRGSAGAVALVLLGLALIAIASFWYWGVTLPDLINGFRGFLGF